MRAIILVGGRGTRLQPLTDSRPKPMLPIVNVPFLQYQLSWLKHHGIVDVTFACGFMPQEIVGYFSEGTALGMNLGYVVEPEPLDTAGAIAFAARSISATERLIVCNGDIMTDLDLGVLIERHVAATAQATIALTPVDDPSRYGLVRVGESGEVRAFVEKPSPDEIDTNLINAGTYVLESSVIDLIPHAGRCNIEREIFPHLVHDGLYACSSDAYWNDIGTFSSYRQAHIDVLRNRVGGVDEATGRDISRGKPIIEESAMVSEDARIEEPVFIGSGVSVAASATIGPDTVVLAGARIGPGARVVRSVILEDAAIGRDAQIVDSVVGERAVVGDRCSVTDDAVISPKSTVEMPVMRGGVR